MFDPQEDMCPSARMTPLETRPQLLMPRSVGRCMSEWPELKPMKNRLVNYGVSDNGVAIIELISDSDGEALEGDKTSVNTYTREMLSLIHI